MLIKAYLQSKNADNIYVIVNEGYSAIGRNQVHMKKLDMVAGGGVYKLWASQMLCLQALTRPSMSNRDTIVLENSGSIIATS